MLAQPNKWLVFGGVLVLLSIVHAWGYQASEPFYNNDETRHVMTGVYFKDALEDMPVRGLRDYTINYYLQYPALGLLIWPPLFYFIEGLAMTLFGTSIVVSKTLIALFTALAFFYLFKLVARTHDVTRAALAVLFFGLAPLVFVLSHYVMLEMPTVAFALAATYHFVAFLDAERRRDLIGAGLFAALAALTRFDAVYLLPLFLLLVATRKRWGLLKRPDVWIVAVLALLIVAPVYAASAKSVGSVQFKFVTDTLDPNDPGFLSLKRLLFYPSHLKAQLGLLVLIPALAAIIFYLRGAWRNPALTYFAIIIAVYVTFTPMGELISRHTVYWVPAFAFFAAEGVMLAASLLRSQKLRLPLAAVVLLSLVWVNYAKPIDYVRGYEEAARYVLTNTQSSPFTMFVGHLNGNFIYQTRRHDEQRRLWVLRADKILYNILSVPGVEAKQLAADEAEILNKIFKYDPEYIVVEESPKPLLSNPDDHVRAVYEKQLRSILVNHPERFRLEKVIPISSTDPDFSQMELKIFRNLLRNEKREQRLEVELLMLRDSFKTDVP